MIYCDLNETRVLPITQGQPILTKGKSRPQQIKAWLTESRQYMVMEDYVIFIPWLNLEILIPKGFIYDGASVPRVLWPLLQPDGILLIPAIIHDFGYRYNAYVRYGDNTIVCAGVGKAFHDRLFKNVAVAVNDMPILGTIAWVGLGLGGWLPWRNRRKADQKLQEDFPNVFVDRGDCVPAHEYEVEYDEMGG